ncbi:putative mitochondrial import receptor subunit [Phaeomoniella chlamydospora]|uniref:Mitochondrial import receptor subunit TOM20 n=1 Tax=Phaeomoniella chlamydospora TaxID=158046 RepID=A0A0G2F2Y0_PHACM|nr:putative mitochondrial import receptor subunit [Phaeomoniella chlamydospora]
MKTSTIVAASVGTAVTGFLAYAVYFDYKRRNDTEFRKALKRESRRQARAAKEEKEAQGKEQEAAIKQAVDDAKAAGFPPTLEEKEAYFMEEVAQGEGMASDGSDPIAAALCFYKALKVYPQPKDLINIYDKTVPKEILEILALMVAHDQDLKLGASFTGGSDAAAENHVE